MSYITFKGLSLKQIKQISLEGESSTSKSLVLKMNINQIPQTTCKFPLTHFNMGNACHFHFMLLSVTFHEKHKNIETTISTTKTKKTPFLSLAI